MENKIRKVDSNLTGETGLTILNSVMGQLSDGIWENSRSMEKYWKYISSIYLEGNHVIINVRNDSYDTGTNPYYNMSDSQIREFFAKKIKAVVKEELAYDGDLKGWDRKNEKESTYLSRREKTVRIKDAYYAYEKMLGRNTLKHREYEDLKTEHCHSKLGKLIREGIDYDTWLEKRYAESQGEDMNGNPLYGEDDDEDPNWTESIEEFTDEDYKELVDLESKLFKRFGNDNAGKEKPNSEGLKNEDGVYVFDDYMQIDFEETFKPSLDNLSEWYADSILPLRSSPEENHKDILAVEKTPEFKEIYKILSKFNDIFLARWKNR